MRSFCLSLVLLVCCLYTGFSQRGVELPNYLNRDKIPFELINNLVIIPVEVNGKKLSFLLDTGVDATIVFGVTEADSLLVKNIKPVKVIGFGTGEGVDALISRNNQIKIGKARDLNHTIYVIFDESFNFSQRMGVPIHGIIGHDFFRNFIVKTNYVSKRIIISNPATYNYRKCKKCEEFDLTFYNNKPYVDLEMSVSSKERESIKLLIDSGSSDALWLFREEESINADSTKYFNDFLGLGFSGGIFGKRSKLDEVWLGGFSLKGVKVAFPDKEAIDGIKFFRERDGSLGGEILKRFTVIFDYPNKKMTLKKNGNYNKPFYYNMSGLIIEHGGMIVVRDVEKSVVNTLNSEQAGDNNGMITLQIDPNYSFFLAPSYIIAEVRENSPGALAGLRKGDEILRINGKDAYRFKLHEIIALYSSETGKVISMDISRNGIKSKAKFTLEKVL